MPGAKRHSVRSLIEAEAVGQLDSGRWGGSRSLAAQSRANEVPHPQVEVALGLRIVK